MSAESSKRIGALLLTGLFVLCLGLALIVDPGPFSIDEATYQHMVQSFVQGHGVHVWNGYAEYPSPELTSRWIRESGGQLSGQYPFLFVLLAAPFQAALGFRGLFVVSALAFVAGTWLCFRLSRQLLGSLPAAYLGAATFAIASFAGNYAVAAWPHALALALVLGAASLAAEAWHDGDRVSLRALGTGACLGFGLGVRLDTALVAPVLLTPFVLARPLRWRTLLGFAIGALGPIAASSVINGLRWGEWSPASYGRSVVQIWPVALAVLGALAAVALAHLRERLGALRPRRLLAAALLLLLPCLLIPQARQLGIAWSRGLWTLVVDLAALPLEQLEPGMSRTAQGGVVYYATVKKALLQSCPYLTVLLALITLPPRSPTERKAIALLLAAPLLIIVFYARTAWHGGLSFNLRYFSLCLPFFGILSGYVLARLAEGDGSVQARTGGILMAGVALCAWLLAPWRFTTEQGYTWFARAPLVLTSLVALSALAWLLWPRRSTARICSALACTAAAHAAVAGLAYDAPRAQGVRSINYGLAGFIGENVKDDSLVFVQHPDPLYSLIESRHRVRIAIPSNDRFRDMTGLMDFHLARRRPVYAAFDASLWAELDKTPASRRYRMHPMLQAGPYILRRIMPLHSGTPAALPASATSR